MRENYSKILLSILAFILLNVRTGDACTIFYFCNDGVILGGANEDWKDPGTHMWFYAADSSGHGWVKFGFESGFPQAGMNDQGLFWDGTSNPYLPMPESEAGKMLYDGPLMQKVIRECANISEAEVIFKQYYCQDQYRAQYLLGDSSACSMIVEGDNIIHSDHAYQVLTNFYHSHPELGGYPCWRYEKAVEILDTCSVPSVYTAAYLLASTHQEGNYPTQYSVIFMPQQREIILFCQHNFDEFLIINLQEELQKGCMDYEIPGIFSRVELSRPAHGAMITSDSVMIEWKGLPDNHYTVLLSKYPDFHDTASAHITMGRKENNASGIYFAGLGIIILGILFKNGRSRFILFLVCFSVLCVSCDKQDDETGIADASINFSRSFADLDPETTYYWKIIARKSIDSHFATQTATRRFLTSSGLLAE